MLQYCCVHIICFKQSNNRQSVFLCVYVRENPRKRMNKKIVGLCNRTEVQYNRSHNLLGVHLRVISNVSFRSWENYNAKHYRSRGWAQRVEERERSLEVDCRGGQSPQGIVPYIRTRNFLNCVSECNNVFSVVNLLAPQNVFVALGVAIAG